VKHGVGAVLLAAIMAFSWDAAARTQRDLPYGVSQAWTTAIRLLRLDLGYEVGERDRDAGFVLFTYLEGETRCPGTLEVVERQLSDGRTGVRVVVTIPAMPSYVEQVLIDRLLRKLRDELGAPLPPPPRRRPPPARDAEEEREGEAETDDDSETDGNEDQDDQPETRRDDD